MDDIRAEVFNLIAGRRAEPYSELREPEGMPANGGVDAAADPDQARRSLHWD
jgi:hypothetical protein